MVQDQLFKFVANHGSFSSAAIIETQALHEAHPTIPLSHSQEPHSPASRTASGIGGERNLTTDDNGSDLNLD
uniref:Uncharacterized protein n=1 Tax=Cannabis sativa TaxID=3483 RepID=A0A803QMZ5_CANSA